MAATSKECCCFSTTLPWGIAFGLCQLAYDESSSLHLNLFYQFPPSLLFRDGGAGRRMGAVCWRPQAESMLLLRSITPHRHSGICFWAIYQLVYDTSNFLHLTCLVNSFLRCCLRPVSGVVYRRPQAESAASQRQRLRELSLVIASWLTMPVAPRSSFHLSTPSFVVF